MNRLVASAVLIGACVVASPRPPVAHRPPPPPVAVVVPVPFEDALRPHGQWVVVARFGRVWRPHAHLVGAAFVPYLTGGHWVLTEHGWIFESEWPWGWAAFHYGRWYLDPLEGWVWVPDDVWGPSWVEWRSSDGFVGWVPLPPHGLELVFPAYRPRWCWVETRHFTHDDMWKYRIDEPRERHTASPVPPSAEQVSRGTGTPVRTVEVGPRPPPGEVRAVRRPEPPPGVAVPAPPPAPPPPARIIEPQQPARVEPPPPSPRPFERPTDRRPEPPPPAQAAPPPPHRFERPADRRPEPVKPWRIEPSPRQPAPAPAPPAAPPQREDPRKKKRPLSS